MRGSLSRAAPVCKAACKMILPGFAAGARRPLKETGDEKRHGFITRFPLLRIPRCVGDGRLVLKPLRITDGPFLHKGLRNADILRTSVCGAVRFRSWVDVWWWLRKTYPILYRIEADSKRIGFIGLFDIIRGESGEASLAIFNSAKRRCGHGSAAFRLFSEELRKHSLIERIFVRVREDNDAAQSFWSRLGFKESGTEGRIRVMSLCLRSRAVCTGR